MGSSVSTINATTLTIKNKEGVVTANGFQINADNGAPTVTGGVWGTLGGVWGTLSRFPFVAASPLVTPAGLEGLMGPRRSIAASSPSQGSVPLQK